MSKPFYCEYRGVVDSGKFPFEGALRADTLAGLKREMKAFVKRARECGAKSVHFRGIVETRIKYHGKFDDVIFS